MDCRSVACGGARATSEEEPDDNALRPLVAVVRSTGDAVVSIGPGCRITTWNHGAESCYGYSAAEAIGKPIGMLIPEERRDEWRALCEGLKRGKPVERCETERLRKDGTVVAVAMSLAPMTDDKGALVSIASLSRDITKRKRAEEALRQSEEQYRSLYSKTPAMMHSIDRNARLVSVSNMWLETLGYERAEVIGRKVVEFVTPESRRYAEEVVMPAFFKTGASKDIAYQFVKKNGEVIDVLLSATSEKDAHGRVLRSLSVLVDVTERKRAEAHQKLLIDELNHRVKNTLATVQSIAMASARSAQSLERFQEAFEGRLLALSHVHDLLASSAWQGVSLKDLLERTLAPYGGDEGRVAIEGPAVQLGSNAAVGLAMAFHELATNAVKYGALSAPGGRAVVTWTAHRWSGPGALEIRWVERNGPPVAPPSRRGFGSRLIERGLARALDAELRLEFLPAGLECGMRLPLSRKVSPA